MCVLIGDCHELGVPYRYNIDDKRTFNLNRDQTRKGRLYALRALLPRLFQVVAPASNMTL